MLITRCEIFMWLFKFLFCLLSFQFFSICQYWVRFHPKLIWLGPNQEQSSDEEAPLEQEEEFRALQQDIAASLRPEDFGYEDSEEEDAGGEDTFEEAARKESKLKTEEKRSIDKVITDGTIELKKDITALSKKEQMEVLMRSFFWKTSKTRWILYFNISETHFWFT